jgi:hypothetical protein
MTTVDRLPDHLERIGCQLTAAAQDLYGLSSPSERQASERQALRRQLVGQSRPRPRRRPRMRIFAGVSAVSAAAAIRGARGEHGIRWTHSGRRGHHPPRAPCRDPAGGRDPAYEGGRHPERGDVRGGGLRQTAPPYAGRAIKDQVEFSDNSTTSFEYDPATNTIYERPDSSPRPAPNDPVAQIRQELASGQAQVNGTVVIEGTSLYKIDLPRGVVGYFDTRNYAPRYVDAPQRDGTVVRFRVEVYEYLPMTPANRDLLSVTAQHPGARIDTNPSDAPAF